MTIRTTTESPLEDYTQVARKLYLQWFTTMWSLTWAPYLAAANVLTKTKEEAETK